MFEYLVIIGAPYSDICKGRINLYRSVTALDGTIYLVDINGTRYLGLI